jgi:hypothetical protein
VLFIWSELQFGAKRNGGRKALGNLEERYKEVVWSELAGRANVADDEKRNRAVWNAGHHPKAILPPKIARVILSAA